MTKSVAEGDQAPNFSLEADDGTTVRRDSLAGKNVILYFYPKDDTTGCTKEACDFRDAFRDSAKSTRQGDATGTAAFLPSSIPNPSTIVPKTSAADVNSGTVFPK